MEGGRRRDVVSPPERLRPGEVARLRGRPIAESGRTMERQERGRGDGIQKSDFSRSSSEALEGDSSK